MIEEVPLEKLKIRKNRIREDVGDLTDLMSSMTEVGQLNSLTIDEDYYILEGTRRYYSAKNLGWSSIQCEKRIGLSDYQKLLIEIDENLRRKNFNPAEEAKALALKKREYLKLHPEFKRGGDRKSDKFRQEKKNQNANVALGFAKTQAREIGSSERTLKTKTKIGEFILDDKLGHKTIDQFSKRKLSQRKLLEEIKIIEREEETEVATPRKDFLKIQLKKNSATIAVPKKIDGKSNELKKSKGKEHKETDETVLYCVDCKIGLQLTCPNCKDAFISCLRYKNPQLRRIDSEACEEFHKRL
jgi:ParB family chromosome partitioning protein